MVMMMMMDTMIVMVTTRTVLLVVTMTMITIIISRKYLVIALNPASAHEQRSCARRYLPECLLKPSHLSLDHRRRAG